MCISKGRLGNVHIGLELGLERGKGKREKGKLVRALHALDMG